MEVLHTPPSQSDFVPLSEHQSHTPESFFHGPPILHHFSPSCSLSISPHDLAIAPALSQLAAGGTAAINGHANGYSNGQHDEAKEHTNMDDGVDGDEGEEEEEGPDIVIPSIEIWVTSRTFILYSRPLSTGLSIPYNYISLHAIQRQINALYMQLRRSAAGAAAGDGDGDDTQLDDYDDVDSTISLSLIFTAPAHAPPVSSSPSSSTPTIPPSTSAPSAQDPTTTTPDAKDTDELSTLYAALSACANLHPDPRLPGDESESESDPAFSDAAGDAVLGTPQQGFGNEDNDLWEHVDPTYADGLPPPMPGSGGWITAENADRFFDAEGNWIGRGGNGSGGGDEEEQQQPGTVRRRRDDDVGREDGGEVEEEMEGMQEQEAGSMDHDGAGTATADAHPAGDEPSTGGGGDVANKWRRTG